MGIRRSFAFAALVSAVVLVGCSDPTSGPLAALGGGGATAGDLLYVTTPEGLTALDVSTAAARFRASGGVAAPDWSQIFTTEPTHDGTRVNVLDPETGAASRLRDLGIPGLVARTASISGDAVVLGARAPEADRPYPAGRERTTLVVVRNDGSGRARSYDLKGNFEPEAFSTDASSLFVIHYTPAAAPTQYRVRRLDLTTGGVSDTLSRDKELQEAMPGTARTQTRSPDGRRLYTLYEVEHLHTAFIHVLDLDEQWAHCIDLPKPFGKHPGGASALTLSPDGSSLYVAEQTGGALAAIDTQALKVTRTGRLSPQPRARSAAATTSGGLLYVGGGSRISAIDTEGLRTIRAWRAPGEVTAVEASSDGTYLYAALRRKVAVFQTTSGAVQEMIGVPGAESITSVGSPGLAPELGTIRCAC